jgi:hypothetical protein
MSTVESVETEAVSSSVIVARMGVGAVSEMPPEKAASCAQWSRAVANWPAVWLLHVVQACVAAGLTFTGVVIVNVAGANGGGG